MERSVCLPTQVRDAFGNAATAPEGALSADHAKPGYTLDLTPLDPPKMKGGVGAYEVSLEPTKSGTHVVHIRRACSCSNKYSLLRAYAPPLRVPERVTTTKKTTTF